jgi:ATP-binding cassette, subfamily B, multidrug efflux pump
LATQTIEVEKQPEANMHWLMSFILRHKKAAIIATISGMIGGVTLALEPYYIGIIIDTINQEGVTMQQITYQVGVMLALSLTTVVMFFAQRHYSGEVAYAVHFDIRKVVFEHMVTLDNDFYRKYETGDLISRLFSDLNWVWRLLALGFNRIGNAITAFFMTIFLLGKIDIPLTIVVFVILGISTYIQLRAGILLVPISEKVQDQAGKLSSLVQDSVSGIQTVKTFGREEDLARAFHKENRDYRNIWLEFKRRNEPVGMLPQMISYLTTGLVVMFGGMMALNGRITLGNFAQFLLYLNLISRILLMIGTTAQRYFQTLGALQRISPLLQPPHIRDTEKSVTLPEAKGDITFENVGLQEDGNWLLRNINLHIPSGSIVGLVGATGSGKTVLVNLLSRVTDVDEGQVKIDGMDVRDIKLEDLREAIAYVPQQTFLFSQPLHENVRMGHPQMSDDEIERAIHISRVSNDLPQMPDGLDTLVGERGVMLSGGQKQRVAIARAIARDPAILILDDALSSVDTQTAAEILKDMREVLHTRTSILIAQRMATVKDADVIVVMSDGKIAEKGTHEELLKQGGVYASMVEREAQQESELLQ